MTRKYYDVELPNLFTLLNYLALEVTFEANDVELDDCLFLAVLMEEFWACCFAATYGVGGNDVRD